MRKERDNRGPDAMISPVATNQHGVMSADQLRSAGLSPAGVSRRVAAARLHRIHRGVYAVGHPKLSDRGWWMAAVPACGDGAALSHLSAAELWGIYRRVRRLSGAGGRGGPDPVHVMVPSTTGRRRQAG